MLTVAAVEKITGNSGYWLIERTLQVFTLSIIILEFVKVNTRLEKYVYCSRENSACLDMKICFVFISMNEQIENASKRNNFSNCNSGRKIGS